MSTGSNSISNSSNISSNTNSTNDGEATDKSVKSSKLNNTSSATTGGGGGNSSTASNQNNNSNDKNYNNNGASNGSVKNRGPGRPSKKSLSTICAWCTENKSALKYVLPTQSGKKEFCSETCIAEFRKAYSKGACQQCDNAIRANAPNREFCSTFCMNKFQRRNGSSATASATANTNGVQTSSGRLSTSSSSAAASPGSATLQHNNNNVINFDNKNNYADRGATVWDRNAVIVDCADHGSGGSEQSIANTKAMIPTSINQLVVQYERCRAFNWAVYLNVDQLSNQFWSSD